MEHRNVTIGIKSNRQFRIFFLFNFDIKSGFGSLTRHKDGPSWGDEYLCGSVEILFMVRAVLRFWSGKTCWFDHAGLLNFSHVAMFPENVAKSDRMDNRD